MNRGWVGKPAPCARAVDSTPPWGPFPAKVDEILAQVRGEIRARQEELAALLESDATEPARDAVRELRFLAKVAADVESMLAALD